MKENSEWKRLKLYGQAQSGDEAAENGRREAEMAGESRDRAAVESSGKSSTYLLAREESQVERQKQLLYEVLGPVFFGKEEARDAAGLAALFRLRYGIDVGEDFYDGDEHYEEYQEARQAIAEGMSIYSGEIPFDDNALADLAERLWERMESGDRTRFRRINTMLEE